MLTPSTPSLRYRLSIHSGVATLRPRDNSAPSDETRPYNPGEAAGVYKNSKVLAERLVERYVAERGLPAIIVNPSTPIGPGDVKPTPTGKVVLDAARGRIPAFIDTGINIVHVDDVAAGHLAAAARGMVGERFVLGGQMTGELLHLVFGETTEFISLDPWPSSNIGNGVLSFAISCKIITRLTGILS